MLRNTALLLVLCATGAAAACAAKGSEDDTLPLVPKDSGVDANNETTGEDTAPLGPANDFPAAPIIDKAAASAPTLFGPAGSGAMDGPCLIEPQVGSLIPRNFLRPRFRYGLRRTHRGLLAYPTPIPHRRRFLVRQRNQVAIVRLRRRPLQL